MSQHRAIAARLAAPALSTSLSFAINYLVNLITYLSTRRRKASAVSESAGKKDSMASSERVISTGVPKTVVVLKNERG